MSHISEIVVQMKIKFQDPYLILAGDYNQWKVEEYLADFVDLKEEEVGPTRGRRSIDRFFVNFKRSVVESGTLAPLEAEQTGATSDHRITYLRAAIKKKETFKWETYSYRHRTPEAREAFKSRIVLHDWQSVYNPVGTDTETNEYQRVLGEAIDAFFPLKTTRRKSNDLPWMIRWILKRITGRKKIFAEAGGSERMPGERKKGRLAS